MHLLFIAPVAKTYHETTLGLDLADQLAGAGCRAHFLVDPFNAAQAAARGYPHTVAATGRDDLQATVDHLVRRLRPNAIVLCDYLAYCMSLEKGHHTDPWFIERYRLPVIPLDPYDLVGTDFRIDVLGHDDMLDDRIARLPGSLLPVPMARPGAGAGAGIPYRANASLQPLAAHRRRELRARLGAGSGDRILMVPTLDWQNSVRIRGTDRARAVATHIPELIVAYLRQLPETTRFVLVGPHFPAYDRLPEARRRVIVDYTAREYDELVGIADGVFAYHLPAFALERAVFADVPGMFAWNSLALTGAGALDQLAAAFGEVGPNVSTLVRTFPGDLPSFTMWPLGWNSFVRPVLRDNPYPQVGLAEEILDEPAMVRKLRGLLYDEDLRDRLAGARAAYRAQIEALPPTAESFLTAVRRWETSHGSGAYTPPREEFEVPL